MRDLLLQCSTTSLKTPPPLRPATAAAPHTPTNKAAPKTNEEKNAKKEKVCGMAHSSGLASLAWLDPLPPLQAPCRSATNSRVRCSPAFSPLRRCLLHPQDPNAPKRALGAYMFFSADKRGEVRPDREGDGGRHCASPPTRAE